MENLNSVCYINKINKVENIIGADKIELVTVNGWTSVVQKGIYKEGDLVLCVTTDAIIPEELATKWNIKEYLRKGNRVRTVKLRGVYSECLLIPVGQLPHNFPKEGEDLMEILGVFKYEPPVKIVQLSGGKKIRYDENPNFHVYYKFPNAKNTTNMFNEEDEVVITRKIHGTNARYGIVRKKKLSLWDKIKFFFTKDPWINYEYIYGSHNVEKGSDSQGFYSSDVWREVATKNKIESSLWYMARREGVDRIGEGLIIYGEIYGPGIQGDKYHYNMSEINFAGFDIKMNGNYIDHYIKDLMFDDLELDMVPVLYMGNWSKEEETKYLHDVICDKIPHEGIVVSSVYGERNKIYKVINPDYSIFSEKWVVPDSH